MHKLFHVDQKAVTSTYPAIITSINACVGIAWPHNHCICMHWNRMLDELCFPLIVFENASEKNYVAVLFCLGS